MIALAPSTILLAALLASTPAPTGPPHWNWISQPLDTTLAAVDPSGEHARLVNGEIARIRENYDARGVIRPHFAAPAEIRGRALSRLFPRHRFYAIAWNEEIVQPALVPVSTGIGLYDTIAIDETGRTSRFLGYGNYEEFGRFLVAERVAIGSADDARLVWDAFCEAHRKAWKAQPNELVSDREWRLGFYRYDSTRAVAANGEKTVATFTHYTRVLTDPRAGSAIVSWESVCEMSDPRVIPPENR